MHRREENEISKVKKNLGRALCVSTAIRAEDHLARARVSAHGCLINSRISLSVFAAPYYNPEGFFYCLILSRQELSLPFKLNKHYQQRCNLKRA